MASLGDITNKARALTHTDTTTYTAANVIIDVNLWYQKIVSMILECQDDTDFDDSRQTNYPIATRALIASQRDYSFSTASWTLQGKEGAAGTASQTLLPLKIKRVDITYDGTNWYRATPVDENEIAYGTGNDTILDSNFFPTAPNYAIRANAILVYPMATSSQVAAGASIRIVQDRTIIPFTSSDYSSDPSDSSAVPGIDSPFHMMMAYGMAYEVANANNLPQLQNFKQDLVDYEARLRYAYSSKNRDTQYNLQNAYDESYGR